MSTGDLPAVARRRVRLAVREARERKGLTQADVAEAMEWSASKIMRIESGEVTVSPNDLRPLLAYLGIQDRVRVEELIQDAKASRRRQEWWDEPRFREYLTPAMRQLIQYEVQAHVVKYFYMTLIPGRLQTPAYAEALLRSYGDWLEGHERDIRLEARVRRRKELMARKDRPDIQLLLDESVLRRKIGGGRVMGDQLRDLVQLADQERVRVRVVPFELQTAPPPLLGSFEVLYLGTDEDAVMYYESALVDEIIEDKADIKRHLESFSRLWDTGLDEAISVRLIQDCADRALATADNRMPG